MTTGGHTCYLCGSPLSFAYAASDYITGEAFSLYRCVTCTLGQTLPRLSTGELSPYYAGVYYKQRKSFTDSHINRVRLRHIEGAHTQNTAGQRIVDIGCGNGALVEMLVAHGWDASGTEVAPPEHFVSDTVRQHIYIGEFTQASFPSDSFAAATLWHVLEHVADPRAYIRELHRTEEDAALLIIEVPNIDSWQSRMTRGNWFNLDMPRHVFHFTPTSIALLLSKEGYRIARTSHYSAVYSVYGWLQSLLNMVTRRKNILFDLLNHKVTLTNYRTHAIVGWEIFTTIVLALPFFIVSIPLTMIETLCKRGGVITVYAQKIASPS